MDRAATRRPHSLIAMAALGVIALTGCGGGSSVSVNSSRTTSSASSSGPATSSTSSSQSAPEPSSASGSSGSGAAAAATQAQVDAAVATLNKQGAVTSVFPKSYFATYDKSQKSTTDSLARLTVTPASCKSKISTIVDNRPVGAPSAGGSGTGQNNGTLILRGASNSSGKRYVDAIRDFHMSCPKYTVDGMSGTKKVHRTTVSQIVDGVNADGFDDVVAMRITDTSSSTSLDYVVVDASGSGTVAQLVTAVATATTAQLNTALAKVGAAVKDSRATG